MPGAEGTQTLAASDFLSFMMEREALRRRRASGLPPPWTNDRILAEYHFTNVKREHDATTVWMRQHWTGPNADRASAGEVVFNCALFRQFGTIAFAQQMGWVRNFSHVACVNAAVTARRTCGHAFTRAYCLPSFNAEIKSEESARREYEKKCQRVLGPLWSRRHEFDAVCVEKGKWQDVAVLLGQMPGFGGSGFMAKETLLDVMQTCHLRHCTDRNLWTGIGPGGRRGLNRLAGRHKHSVPTKGSSANRKRKSPEGSATESTEKVQALNADGDRLLAECIALHRECWRLDPKWCASVDLELSDTQFQLCEFDKYLRIRNGEGGRARRYAAGMRAKPNTG